MLLNTWRWLRTLSAAARPLLPVACCSGNTWLNVAAPVVLLASGKTTTKPDVSFGPPIVVVGGACCTCSCTHCCCCHTVCIWWRPGFVALTFAGFIVSSRRVWAARYAERTYWLIQRVWHWINDCRLNRCLPASIYVFVDLVGKCSRLSICILLLFPLLFVVYWYHFSPSPCQRVLLYAVLGFWSQDSWKSHVTCRSKNLDMYWIVSSNCNLVLVACVSWEVLFFILLLFFCSLIWYDVKYICSIILWPGWVYWCLSMQYGAPALHRTGEDYTVLLLLLAASVSMCYLHVRFFYWILPDYYLYSFCSGCGRLAALTNLLSSGVPANGILSVQCSSMVLQLLSSSVFSLCESRPKFSRVLQLSSYYHEPKLFLQRLIRCRSKWRFTSSFAAESD